MDAVLLAGGYGTRLRPLTYTRPKPLLPIAGRPMLEWVLDKLPAEVDHVIVAVNWLADELENYCAARTSGPRVTVVRETEPLGTAGAVANCQSHIQSDSFFVLNADIVSDMDLAAQLAQHHETQAVATIATKTVPLTDVVHFGVVLPDAGDARRIEGFVEKPARPEDAPSQLINAGAYLLRRDVLDLIPPGMCSMEQQIFPQLFDRGFYGCSFGGAWIDVGDPARMRAATQFLDPDFAMGQNSTAAPDARLEDSLVGARCRLGAGVSLVRTILGDDVTVAPGCTLVDCIVGDGQQIEADANGQRIWQGLVPQGYPESQVGNAMN